MGKCRVSSLVGVDGYARFGCAAVWKGDYI